MKKIVGVIVRHWEFNDKAFVGMKEDVLEFLRKFDVDVLLIPILYKNDKLDNIINIINMCDGIILSGGKDIYQIDYEVVKYLHQNDIPTLGICLGMQSMGGAFNGGVISNIGNSSHQSNSLYVHDIKIDKNSLLYSILNREIINVNSRHNDNIKDTDLDIVAYSVDDNIIEAVEDKNKKFFIGVQWHPESILDDENSFKLFKYFVKSL